MFVIVMQIILGLGQGSVFASNLIIGVLLGVLGVLQHSKLLEKSEIFRLSEILGSRLEIFITYLYKKTHFFIFAKMF